MAGMNRRSFLLSAATLFVPVPARPAPFVYVVNLTANKTITFAPPPGVPIVLKLLQGGNTAKTVTWPAGLQWRA